MAQVPRIPFSGVLLIVLGCLFLADQMGVLSFQHFFRQWWPAIMVLVAIVAFARLVDSLGLIVTMVISMTLVALGTPETRWREYLGFAVLMLVIAWGMFIAALKMPIPTWPVAVPPDVQFLLDLLKSGAH